MESIGINEWLLSHRHNPMGETNKNKSYPTRLQGKQSEGWLLLTSILTYPKDTWISKEMSAALDDSLLRVRSEQLDNKCKYFYRYNFPRTLGSWWRSYRRNSTNNHRQSEDLSFELLRSLFAIHGGADSSFVVPRWKSSRYFSVPFQFPIDVPPLLIKDAILSEKGELSLG